MSGPHCPPFDELRCGWKLQEESLRRHLEDCPDCRQILLVSAGLGSLSPRRPASPTLAVHRWRARLRDQLRLTAISTLPICVMYCVSAVGAAGAILWVVEEGALALIPRALPPLGNGILVWGVVFLSLILAGILKTEEE